MIRSNPKDLAGGILLVVIGSVFAIDAWLHLPIRSAVRMGPGYFPFVLGTVLAGIGIYLGARAFVVAGTPFGRVPWRAVVVLAVAPIIVAYVIRGLGLFPSITLAAFIAAYASRRGVSIVFAFSLAIGLAAFCSVLFGYGIKLPIPILGPWIVR